LYRLSGDEAAEIYIDDARRADKEAFAKRGGPAKATRFEQKTCAKPRRLVLPPVRIAHCHDGSCLLVPIRAGGDRGARARQDIFTRISSSDLAIIQMLIDIIAACHQEPPKEGRQRHFAATRQGMKRITVAVSPEDHKKLKVKAAETGRSIEDLMREAVAAVLAKKH
jgi:hypothetical protein